MAAVPGAGRASGSSASQLTHDLYARYGAQLHAFCLSRLRSQEEAEDAVQTTFMNVFRAFQGGTRPEFEQAWVYRIAQNVCAARATSSGRRLRLERPDDLEVLQEVVAAPEQSEAEELFGLEQALASMPENQRRAILLREWQGLSYREIAEQLELTQNSVEMLIFRARRTLAKTLEAPAAEEKQARTRRGLLGGLDLGAIAGAIKTFFTGGAAVKAVVLAVAAGTATGTLSEAASKTIVHRKAAPPVTVISVPRSSGRATAAPVLVSNVAPAAHRAGTGRRPRPAAAEKTAVTETPQPLETSPAPVTTLVVTTAAAPTPAPAASTSSTPQAVSHSAPASSPATTTTHTSPAPPAQQQPAAQDPAPAQPAPAETTSTDTTQTDTTTTTTTAPADTTPTQTDPAPTEPAPSTSTPAPDQSKGDGSGSGDGAAKKPDPKPVAVNPLPAPVTVTTPTTTVQAPTPPAPAPTTPAPAPAPDPGKSAAPAPAPKPAPVAPKPIVGIPGSGHGGNEHGPTG